jgi:transposase-like protein
MRITLPKRVSLKSRTHCIDCKEKLTKENRLRNNGVTKARCKPCNRQFMNKYNEQRKLKRNKLW